TSACAYTCLTGRNVNARSIWAEEIERCGGKYPPHLLLSKSPLGRQLLADRQRPDALARRGKNSVGQCRREGRHAGLADPAWRRVGAGRYNVDIRQQRRFVYTDHREIVEVLLLHFAVLEGDLAIFSEAQAHDCGALDLGLDSLWVDIGSAVDGGVDPRHRELTFVVDGHLDDGRDVADEAPVDGDAKPVSFGNGPSPPALFGKEFDYLAKSGGIDGIAVVGLAIVPQVLGGREIDDPRRADELQQHVFLVAIGGVRELADHGLHGKGVRDVRHRTEPADAGMRGRLWVLALDVGDLERHINKSHTEFERGLVYCILLECRCDAWR